MIRKLMIIILGIFLVICAGSCNLYPLYLNLMMTKYNFTLKQVNLYGSFVNIGLWVAFPMGFIYDKLGPNISCMIGTLLLSGSYLTLYFLFNSAINDLPLILFLFIGIVMGQGSALCYTTSVTTNLKNFRFKESSAIVGLLVANLALSPSVFTTYREFMKDMNTAGYFMVISIFTAVIIGICGIVFHNIKNVYSEDNRSYEQYKEMKAIHILIVINMCILGIYTLGVIINNSGESNRFPLIIVYPCLQLLNFIVVILEKFKVLDKIYFKDFVNKMLIDQIKIEEDMKKSRMLKLDKKDENKTENKEHENTEETINESTNRENFVEINLTNNTNNTINTKNQIDCKAEPILPKEEQNISFFKAINTVEMLFLFTILTLGIGSVIANLNNINFIIKSISPEGENSTHVYNYVIIYFVFNSFIRIISGILLDYLIRIKKYFYYILVLSIIGFLSQLIGIIMNQTIMFISICLAGVTHGGYMTFIPVYVRSEYGLNNMGKILGFLTSGCAVGSILISEFIFGIFWEIYKDNDKCIGIKCFRPSYIITTCLFVFNIVLSAILLKRNLNKN